VLKWLRSYSQLLRSLQPRADAILHGLCEMFDAYLLHTFLLFSGVSLEELVWYDTKVVNRLRSTLLRILTQDTCKYKAQVGSLAGCAQTGCAMPQAVNDFCQGLLGPILKPVAAQAAHPGCCCCWWAD
jgi:hypothetical protein